MSAVCAFRMNRIISVFEHGRWAVQRTPQSLWTPHQKFTPSPAERPGRCVPDSRKLQDVSFVIKNPLLYDAIESVNKAPLLVEGPNRPELTHISVLPQVRSVRGQPHDVLFIGRTDGQLLKVCFGRRGSRLGHFFVLVDWNTLQSNKRSDRADSRLCRVVLAHSSVATTRK